MLLRDNLLRTIVPGLERGNEEAKRGSLIFIPISRYSRRPTPSPFRRNEAAAMLRFKSVHEEADHISGHISLRSMDGCGGDVTPIPLQGGNSRPSTYLPLLED